MRTVPEATLMARAARAVADEIEATLADARQPVAHTRVVVLAGSGNNGGDALLAGALLAMEGAEVTGIETATTAHEAGREALLQARGRVLNAVAESGLRAAHAAMRDADVLIDGIVGIGAKPGLRPPADALVASIPDEALVVAVDLPSGLDADSGVADAPHIVADVTVTFTAPKVCLVTEPAARSAGRVVVANVGVERPAASD